MKKKSLIPHALTVVVLVVGGLFSSASAQTEEEFRQEFQQYAETHSQTEWQAYALFRLNQMTVEAMLQESAWSLLENSFSPSVCLSVKRQLCDAEYEQKLMDATAVLAVASAACLVVGASGGPIFFAVCMAAAATQHALRLAAAKNAHRACYLRARLECLDPTPRCGSLAPVGMMKGPVPSIADCDWSDSCECQPRSPVIVDVAGDGFRLTNQAGGVMFDITGTLGLEQLGWTEANSDDAFLALDLNADGIINNGTELFGNFTVQSVPATGDRNGFEALAVYDGNKDGLIDSRDGVYSELRLWQDSNHNGVSEPHELHRLDQLGVRLLDLKYKLSRRVDQYGNEFRYRAKIKDGRGEQLGHWAWDVFLVSSRRRGLLDGSLLWNSK